MHAYFGKSFQFKHNQNIVVAKERNSRVVLQQQAPKTAYFGKTCSVISLCHFLV